MDNTISEFTHTLWVSNRKTKNSSHGWVNGNAVCCTHNGETPDTRGRGGLICGTDGSVSYACFNCGFKVKYVYGQLLSFKFKKLLSWLGATESDVFRLNVLASKIRGQVDPASIQEEELHIKYKPYAMPDHSTFMETAMLAELQGETFVFPKPVVDAVEYLSRRRINMRSYEFAYSNDQEYNGRVIIPFMWKGKNIGHAAYDYTDKKKLKCFNKVDSDYIFNTDKQKHNWSSVIVVEGIMDAMSIDAVATLGADITEKEVSVIEHLNREIIVVPDFDRTGKRLVESALKYGWAVSFPIWATEGKCKDANDAVVKYGKLFTLYGIFHGKETSNMRIKLLLKKHFGHIK